MTRILIDLTDLELWHGNHGGTQRVVYNIAKYFYSSKENIDQKVEFIAFSNKDNAFHLANFTGIYEEVESLKTVTESSNNSQGLSRKAILKHRLRPYVPEVVRKNQKARQVAIRSVSIGLRVSKKVGRVSRTFKTMPKMSSERVAFQKDDIVLILGKPWDNLRIQEILSRQRNTIGFKLVQIVYDLIISLQPQLHHPSLFAAYTQNMFNTISDSDLLLPISKSSERDLKKFCRLLNLKVPNTEVIRLGDEIVDSLDDNLVKPSKKINDKFIACIGTIEIRKNHMLLYYAYKLGLEKGLDLPQLVVVGSRGWLSGDFQYLVENDPTLKDKVLILDNVNDAGLQWIYKNCLFTIYPSMYEGWGLPVAESLAYNTFCIASDSSSIPEIAGDLIDYFSPYNADECLQKLMNYQDKAELDKRTALLAKHYRPTTWQETSEHVLRLLSSL
jgi:glycosyltransferase involved in cell wall biosynthesis